MEGPTGKNPIEIGSGSNKIHRSEWRERLGRIIEGPKNWQWQQQNWMQDAPNGGTKWKQSQFDAEQMETKLELLLNRTRLQRKIVSDTA